MIDEYETDILPKYKKLSNDRGEMKQIEFKMNQKSTNAEKEIKFFLIGLNLFGYQHYKNNLCVSMT